MEPTTHESRILSVRINRLFQETYDFLSIPENFPKWAQGLGELSANIGDEWIIGTGPASVRFTARNGFGILDHYVTTDSGAQVYVPMRVITNGAGSEVMLVQFRFDGISDEQYAEDARRVWRPRRWLTV